MSLVLLSQTHYFRLWVFFHVGLPSLGSLVDYKKTPQAKIREEKKNAMLDHTTYNALLWLWRGESGGLERSKEEKGESTVSP